MDPETAVQVGHGSLDGLVGEGVVVLAHRSGAGTDDLIRRDGPERVVLGDATGGGNPPVSGDWVGRDRAEVGDQET